jgi:hypothetical protein
LLRALEVFAEFFVRSTLLSALGEAFALGRSDVPDAAQTSLRRSGMREKRP